MILYHVTDVGNLESISEHGLVPQRGRLSEKLGEDEDRVYFFHDPDDVANACLNWLGAEFDDIDEEDGYEHHHVVLECLFPDDEPVNKDFYEHAVASSVPPERIRISRNPSLFVDFCYGDDFVAEYPTLERLN